ncbi:MAG: YlxR family protein [Actinobacteria bacterium]|nr:YlxR family protein [Actinomycetota bacterium]
MTRRGTTASGRAKRLRTCVGCRRRAEPTGLIRLHRGGDGTVGFGAGPGRGAWLCGPPATGACLETAIRRRALERALRHPIPTTEIEALRARLGQ